MSTDWKNRCLGPDGTVRDALAAIEGARGATALILDKDGRLLGTVSDGDIRRGLLRGETLESPVTTVMFTQPVTAASDTPRDALLSLMQAHEIRDVPLIDADGRLVAVRELRELLAADIRDNEVVIMAGGRGRRLMPLTETVPKPMIEVHGRPLLEIILARLIRQGFRKFRFSVHYLSHVIKEHFEDGARWGVSIHYIEETRPLGTGGALSLIEDPPEHALVVMNGDVLTNLDVGWMVEHHERARAAATVGVREHEMQLPYGIFATEGERVRGFREKPVMNFSINAGIYVLEPEVLTLREKGTTFDMPDLIEDCLKSGKLVSAYQITEAWHDVGEMAELERARGERSLAL